MAHSFRDPDREALHLQVDRLELKLRETNHRIANSLQLASALTGTALREVLDPIARSRLTTAHGHIDAIAGVHRMLTEENGTEAVPLHDYLARLVNGLQATIGTGSGGRTVLLRCDPCFATPEIAVSIGMAVNELVSNACKYAYSRDQPGEVRIVFTADAEGFRLEVADDGLLLEMPASSAGSGFGKRMIAAIARRIGAEFRYEYGNPGVRAILAGSTGLLGSRSCAPHASPHCNSSSSAATCIIDQAFQND